MLVWNGNKIIKQFQEAAERAVEATADEIFNASQDDVPVVTGELKASGDVKVSGTKATIEYDADYAAGVHEDPESEGHKFLETNVKLAISRKTLLNNFKKELGK